MYPLYVTYMGCLPVVVWCDSLSTHFSGGSEGEQPQILQLVQKMLFCTVQNQERKIMFRFCLYPQLKGKKKQNMKAELEASLQRCSCMYLWWVCLSSDATGGRRLWSPCGPASRTSPPPARCLDRRRRDDGRACRNIVDIIMSVNIIKNHLVCFYDWEGEILYL